MEKQLSKMTNEELWRLFPIILSQYDPEWAERYLGESALLEAAVGKANIIRISHIGSTSVPGLLAKPTIDILLEMTAECDTEKLIKGLEQAGYIYTPKYENPAPHMMFMKGYTPQGFEGQAFHVHVRYPGDWNELYFRDYLKEHDDAAREYCALKRKLFKAYEHDRDAYTEAKTEFIERYTALAREEYGDRFNPEGIQ